MPIKEKPDHEESMVPMIKEEQSAIKTKPMDTSVSQTVLEEDIENLLDTHQYNALCNLVTFGFC
jgi:hypothetical protein